MENVVIILIGAAVVACAVIYIRKEKKKGKKCIGCPYADQCAGGCEHSKKCEN